MFGAIQTAHSGVRVARIWMDATSDNIANVNTVRSTADPAFQARYVVAQAVEGRHNGVGSGARVAAIRYGSAEGRLASWPTHPLADANGLVRLPDVDMNQEMTNLIMSQRSYQANLQVVRTAREAYQSALQLGRK